jgi:hypothetical protein
MNKKNSILFATLLVVLIGIFSVVFFLWFRSDFKNSPTIESQLKKELAKDGSAVPLSAQSTAKGTQGATQPQASSQTQSAMSSSSEEMPIATAEDGSGDDPVETVSDETDEKDKKTYSNSDLGVSFDYSDDLKISEGTNSLTVKNGDVSWKLKFFKNDKMEDIETWYKGHYDAKDNPSCVFETALVKAGSYETKLAKAGLEGEKCEDSGNYALSPDKTKVVKVDPGKESVENINKVLANFKFNN